MSKTTEQQKTKRRILQNSKIQNAESYRTAKYKTAQKKIDHIVLYVYETIYFMLHGN
jgi:tRNA splicing endonuclease